MSAQDSMQEYANALHRIEELEAELDKVWHHPSCRKSIYDRWSSPCTCEAVNKELEALILSADAEILKLEDHISELEASSGCLREALQLLQHESLNYHSGQIVDKALKGG